MVLIEQETLNVALEALREKLTLPDVAVVQITDNSPRDYDAVVRILNVDFLCIVTNIVTTANFGKIASHLKGISTMEQRPVLLIAKYISPTIMGDLANEGMNLLDCAGNCHIRYERDDRLIFHLGNKGEKNTTMAEKPYPAFQEAGLKVIFYLLNDITNVDKSYREIQGATGISLGAIKNVFNLLTERNFVLQTKERRVLKNVKLLLNLWVENYNQVLKPKLLLNKMSFRTNDQRMNWLSMRLPEGMYWGGEGGANKYDNYLEPGAFDIYTDIPAAHLMKTGMVMPNENGVIKIYQKFWKWETDNQVAPLILIYADLMGSGNSRCIEMAERLLDHELKDYK